MKIVETFAHSEALKKRGERVRHVRGLSHESQEVFAMAIGISHSLLSKLELGKKPVSYRVAKSVASNYGVGVEWIMEGQVESPKKIFKREAQPTQKFNPAEIQEAAMRCKLSGAWIEVFLKILERRKDAIEAGVNDYGVPLERVFDPAVAELKSKLEQEGES